MKVIVNGNELEIPESIKNKIDSMSHYSMGYSHRFSPSGDTLHQGDNGKYFSHVFQTKYGGFNPQLSKDLGWQNYHLQ